MAEHKTKPQNHDQEDQGQPGIGSQHPQGAGPAYKEPSKRGSEGGKPGGKGDHKRG